MNTCDTCKFWNNGEYGHDGSPVYRLCKFRNSSPDQLNGLEMVNGEPYGGSELATGPKYGCVNHEEK